MRRGTAAPKESFKGSKSPPPREGGLFGLFGNSTGGSAAGKSTHRCNKGAAAPRVPKESKEYTPTG